MGALFGLALARLQFWPWPVVEEVAQVAQSYREFGAAIPEGRRMRAPEGASRERFTIHDAGSMQGGYYAIAGWNDAAGEYGAWLYDAKGKLLHTWRVDYALLGTGDRLDEGDGPHGFVVLPDGSVIANFDGGQAMGRFDEELAKAGILLAADGLKPSSQGKRVAFDGSGRTVIDGPFAATRELVAGFWLWEVEDMDEAVAWVKRCPNPMPGPSEIEIRPLYEMADLR